MENIKNLINKGRYADASALAIHLKKTKETRSLFAKDKFMNEEKFDAFENLLLADAQDDFDCYNRFLDYRQPLRRNLYLDRRKYLKPIADEITAMYTGKKGAAEVLRIKLRTRSAKSEFFNRVAFWVQGKQPHGETLYCVGGGRLRDNMYDKRVAFIDEYWHRHIEVFPEAKVVRKSKEYASVWLSDREYADISTVTVGGSIEGWAQCTNLLIMDDLVASSEINSEKRLQDIYSDDILNAIMRRYISGPIILIGTPIPTLTGVDDPLDAFFENRKGAGYNCKEYVVPSLNENMESNYVYRDFSVDPIRERFTTKEFLKERRAAYKDENPLAKAIFETTYQMQPMSAGAKRFENLQEFEYLPTGRYREINKLDPADTGTDKAAFINGRVYDSEKDTIYIYDIFYDDRPMDRIINGGYLDDLMDFCIRNDIHTIDYEANMGGTLLGETLIAIAKEKGWRFSYDTFKQNKNKNTRINDIALETLRVVRVRKYPTSEMYKDAIHEIKNWTNVSAKNDATDCLTLVVEDFITPPKKINQFMIPKNPIL